MKAVYEWKKLLKAVCKEVCKEKGWEEGKNCEINYEAKADVKADKLTFVARIHPYDQVEEIEIKGVIK